MIKKWQVRGMTRQVSPKSNAKNKPTEERGEKKKVYKRRRKGGSKN